MSKPYSKKYFKQNLYKLTEREQRILDLRFGINNKEKTHTLEEIGEEFGVTRERIRQIIEKGLNKIN